MVRASVYLMHACNFAIPSLGTCSWAMEGFQLKGKAIRASNAQLKLLDPGLATHKQPESQSSALLRDCCGYQLI